MLPVRPDVIDHHVPGQPEEPAPEWDASLLVARERLQGLDEDGLRQVLRVARAANAGGDVAMDGLMEVVEEPAERLCVAGLRRGHELLDRGVVRTSHNERRAPRVRASPRAAARGDARGWRPDRAGRGAPAARRIASSPKPASAATA